MNTPARPKRIPHRRPPWIVWIRVRQTEEEKAWEDAWGEEIERRIADDARDEHGRRGTPFEEIVAQWEREWRVEAGSTRAHRRTWRRRVSRARHTRNIARTVLSRRFDVPHIQVCSADLDADPRVIEPPWHRREGHGPDRHDGPHVIVGDHDDAALVEDLEALCNEVREALEQAWDARLPWTEVEPRLRAKYGGHWLGSHVGSDPPAYEDVEAAFEASKAATTTTMGASPS
jgi:hypothetical protein